MAHRGGRGRADELVAAGPFAFVRNPIFSAMVPAFAGTALPVPNAAAILGVAALVAAVEIQVRLLHEPHLPRAHGARLTGNLVGVVREGRPKGKTQA